METTEKYEHKFPNQDNDLLQRKQKAKQERKHYRNGSAAAIIYLVSTIKTLSTHLVHIIHSLGGLRMRRVVVGSLQ